MAWDLAHTPTTDIRVQACGDAHLLNFGIFAAPDRRLVFDVNDFDETLPASFEWDVKRLAASVVVAARERGFADRHGCAAARRAASAYRTQMERFADMTFLDVWYSRIDVDGLIRMWDAVESQADVRRRHWAVLMVQKHPQLRERLHRRWFFRPSHPSTLLAMAGVAVGLTSVRRWPVAKPWVSLRAERSNLVPV